MSTAQEQKSKLYRFAFSKLIVIVLCATLCAALTVSLANDLFAFVKPSKDIIFKTDEPLSISELSRELQAAGVIENSFAFGLYATLKEKGALLEEFYGEIKLNSSMSYREILNEFKNF